MYIGTRERHLETVLLASLQQLIFVRDFPRCLFQVVLQVKTAPQNDYVNTKLVRGGMVRIAGWLSTEPRPPSSLLAGVHGADRF